MSSRTVLVTGATGLLGREVTKAFRERGWNVKGTGLSRADGVDILKVDLLKEDEVRSVLDQTKPQAIIHCAAERFPDKVDKNPDGARALNIQASRCLAKLAAARDIFLIYISTDYVFPGVPGEAPYENDAKPAPTNLYGVTKADGETSTREEFSAAGNKDGAFAILRVPVLYGHAQSPSESAVNSLMDALSKAQAPGSQTKMDHWSLRYPTCTSDVARVCHDVTAKYTDPSDATAKPDILQFSSEEKMTKYEICQKFADITGLSMDGLVANEEGNDPNAAVQRPYDCHLSTKALRELGIDVSTVGFVDWWRKEVESSK